MRQFGAIFEDEQSDFSAVQTVWRRGRDYFTEPAIGVGLSHVLGLSAFCT